MHGMIAIHVIIGAIETAGSPPDRVVTPQIVAACSSRAAMLQFNHIDGARQFLVTVYDQKPVE